MTTISIPEEIVEQPPVPKMVWYVVVVRPDASVDGITIDQGRANSWKQPESGSGQWHFHRESEATEFDSVEQAHELADDVDQWYRKHQRPEASQIRTRMKA